MAKNHSNKKRLINVDDILSDTSDSRKKDIDLDEIITGGSLTSECEIRCRVVPSNMDTKDPEETWFSSFGLPLMSAQEKESFTKKMKKNHDNYQKSMGEFTKYQMDDSTVIKTDITIDPFKPEKRNNKSLQGKAIKDIYDQQVAGPRARPKIIKKKTDTCTIYENESELNGGKIKGTNLCGFDGISDSYKSAAFGNEF